MKIRTQSLVQQLATSLKEFLRNLGRIMEPAAREIPANCVNINALLMHLCDFDQAAYRYVLKWLAYPIHFPGAKMEHALIVNGPPGTGSSLFFERVIAGLYGPSARHIHIDRRSKSNEWASGARFVTAEGSLAFLPAIKSLLTSETVDVRKGQEVHTEENRMNFVFLSSSEEFLPLSLSNRRFMIIEAPPAREPRFYKAVAEEIENGGIVAFRKFLLSRVNLDGFNQFDEPPRDRSFDNKDAA